MGNKVEFYFVNNSGMQLSPTSNFGVMPAICCRGHADSGVGYIGIGCEQWRSNGVRGAKFTGHTSACIGPSSFRQHLCKNIFPSQQKLGHL